MARVARIPRGGVDPVGTPTPTSSGRAATPTGAPLYRQVCEELEALALATPLDSDSPLPSEGQLMARFAVSRGTLRRAVDELATEGLLRAEPGRGTFVVRSTQVRILVGHQLAAVARPDSRFDLDLSRFVPDFEGREACDARVTALPEYRESRRVFVAPDNSLVGLREHALATGKQILVPTYGMRRGIVLLDPDRIPPEAQGLAATLDGLEHWGRRLDLAALRGVGRVDLIVTGAIALTRAGTHFGPGNGYMDFEWGLLRHCSLVAATTEVLALAHGVQVLAEPVRRRPHDVVVDQIVTPDEVIVCPSLPKPDGILWEEILSHPAPAGPYLDELLQDYPGLARRHHPQEI